MGKETCYVKSALFYMEKSIAELTRVIELEQIPLVWLLLYFNKLFSIWEGTALAWTIRLHPVLS